MDFKFRNFHKSNLVIRVQCTVQLLESTNISVLEEQEDEEEEETRANQKWQSNNLMEWSEIKQMI